YPDPAVIYVSGMIAPDDQIFMGPLYQFNEGVPDRNETSRDGLYAARFVAPDGTLLGEIGIPLNYNSPDLQRPVPITFCGFLAPFPRGTERVEIWNRRSERLLAVRTLSPSDPEVLLASPQDGQVVSGSSAWDVTWKAGDPDTKVVTTTVLVSANGQD